MEGATLSGRQTSAYICDAGEELVALRKELVAQSKDDIKFTNTKDELSLVWEEYSDKIVTLYEVKFVLYPCNIICCIFNQKAITKIVSIAASTAVYTWELWCLKIVIHIQW